MSLVMGGKQKSVKSKMQSGDGSCCGGKEDVWTSKEVASAKRYTCPMHPEVISDQPGMCPECGMALIKETRKQKLETRSNHDKHTGHSKNIFKIKFWVSLILTIPVVAYSDISEILFGAMAPEFPGSEYLPFVLGSVVFWYGGWIFIISAWREIRGRAPGMMTLISMAISVAYGYSLAVTFGAPGMALYWELVTLITVMLLGHWLEMRAVTGAHGALKELSKLLPDTVERVTSNELRGKGSATAETEIVPLAELKEGDVVKVRPGGRVPADGVVERGESDVDESMITGESRPVKKEKGGEVIGGTIVKDGSLEIMVTKIGEATFLAGVMRLVAQAQASKSRVQLVADRAARWLTFIALAAGAVTLVAWLLTDLGVPFAVSRVVAVLVIACPHALGLAVPLVASISTTKAAQNGLLVRERRALEAAREVDVVLFDKTGTLTEGSYGVTDIWAVNDRGEDEVLVLAAAVDSHSEHFIARAIVTSAKSRSLSLAEVTEFARIAGKGVRGKVDSRTVFVGGEAILEEAGANVSSEMEEKIKTAANAGKTIIYVVQEGVLVGALGLADVIRAESKEAVAMLKKLGVKTAMITGDSEEVAKWVAEEVGLDEYFARVLPEHKADKVKELQARGQRVAMVGDGINDAPALTQADVGIAVGAGTNVAIESAGIILMRSNPLDIPKIFRLSKLTYRKMIQNLWWAAGYNIIALPLAAGVLYSVGVVLSPALAAVLMSVSTVVVAINAVLLRNQSLS